MNRKEYKTYKRYFIKFWRSEEDLKKDDHRRHFQCCYIKPFDDLDEAIQMCIKLAETFYVTEICYQLCYVLFQAVQQEDGSVKYGNTHLLDEINKFNEMADIEVLSHVAFDWIRMSGGRSLVNSYLEKGEEKEAFKTYKRNVEASGSHSFILSYGKYQKIEIKLFDGRELYPKVEQLFRLYYEHWEIENGITLF